MGHWGWNYLQCVCACLCRAYVETEVQVQSETKIWGVYGNTAVVGVGCGDFDGFSITWC